jgi:hypothetical protein
MPALQLLLNGASMTAQLRNKVTKDDLYGSVKRVVESEGRLLERGYLLPDGRTIRRTQVAYASMDAEGSVAEDPTTYIGEQPAVQIPSSFEQDCPLAPVPLQRLVHFAVGDVYALDVAGLPAGLYETSFNYRASYAPREAFVLVRGSGDAAEAFLLVGDTKSAPFVGQTLSYEFFDAQAGAEEDTDPLDFSMM